VPVPKKGDLSFCKNYPRSKVRWFILKHGGQWKNHEKGDLFVEGKSVEQIDDFKYFGTFLKSSSDNFRHRKKLSWAACITTPTTLERPRFE
jgi:hypothetical protein